jgi:cell division protease FtsH
MFNRNQDQQDQNGQRGPFGGGNGPGFGCGSWNALFWILLAAILVIYLVNPFSSGSAGTQISYSAFLQQVKSDNVKEVTITGNQVTGTLNKAATQQGSSGKTTEYTKFITYLPSFGDNQLLPSLENHGVQITVQPQSGIDWVTILLYFVPFLFILGLGYLLFSRMRTGGGGGIFSMGQSRAKMVSREDVQTTFDDVAGVEGAKVELREIIEYLKRPGQFRRLGGAIPKGVLLVGPPGTGKTLLARAVAGEAGVPFFRITGSDFMEMFVGVGASRVRAMFENAKRAAPSIIFIDEIDSIGRQRGAGLGGGNDEREQTLNQLLSEMDGFEQHESVIVMAATNRPDILDPALLRPGRFDRRITVDLPTTQARLEILKIHARDKPLADDVDLEDTARGTPGFSGADLENLLNEAALIAARRRKDVIEREDIEEARDKVIMGLVREGVALTEEEWRMLAYHESGHAVLAAVLPNADPLHKVTIIPRGRAMGVTQQLPEGDKYIYRREYMIDRMTVMMGGRAAECLVFDTQTSGAEDDLKHATDLARRMVLNWGMSDELGPMSFGHPGQSVFLGQEIAQRREYSEATAREADIEIKEILEQTFDRATGTLREHREALDRLADSLLKKEEIAGEEVLKIVGVEHREKQRRLESGEELIAEMRGREGGAEGQVGGQA